MILLSTSRAVLGKSAWQYRDFDDEEQAAEWLVEHEAEGFVGAVYEFLGGKLVREIPASEWGSWCHEMRGDMRADRQHQLLWSRP